MPIAAPKKLVEKLPAQLICESCGAEFSCGAKVGECWCFAVELKTESLVEMRGKFVNCLCEVCLSATKTPEISMWS